MIAKNLRSLVLGAQDEFNHIHELQLLLHVCLDELANPNKDTETKLNLLLDCYRSQMDCHLNELNWQLETIREQLLGEEADDKET